MTQAPRAWEMIRFQTLFSRAYFSDLFIFQLCLFFRLFNFGDLWMMFVLFMVSLDYLLIRPLIFA
jgi:hypothetical protein